MAAARGRRRSSRFSVHACPTLTVNARRASALIMLECVDREHEWTHNGSREYIVRRRRVLLD